MNPLDDAQPLASLQPLDPLTFPLWGSRLIEASAGTGKTWTIAALYLRLILGHESQACNSASDDAPPPIAPRMPGDILVMTFTRAATRELSDRIRQRLLEAAACFRGESNPSDDDLFLQHLLASYPPGSSRQVAAWRLSSAAQAMDDAAIHTLDAWCQRMLREHAFDSGSLFDDQLVADEQTLLVHAAHDYWRQQVYPLSDEALEQVLKTWGGVPGLVRDVVRLMPVLPTDTQVTPSLAQCIEESLTAYAQAVNTLADGWSGRAQQMLDWLDDQLAHHKSDWNGKKLHPRYYRPWLERIATWASNPLSGDLDVKALERARARFSPEGMLDARVDPSAPMALPPAFALFVALLDAYPRLPMVAPNLRWHAVVHVANRMAYLKRQAGTFGFADLLQRLTLALDGPQGQALRKRILAQFPVALVDEFQDTSPLQYRVLDQLYQIAHNEPRTALLLIGDPKQSIYGFRGADIGSYLAARTATQDRHYVLGTNHRSSLGLVQAVNQVFSKAEETYPLRAFRYVNWVEGRPNNPLPFQPVQARGRTELFHTRMGDLAPVQILVDDALRNQADSREQFAARCAEQIVHWLNDPDAGFVNAETQEFRALVPADVAVLVRTGTEAQAVRRQLRLRGVASVYLSDKDSVFSSQEAFDLWHWLRAVASPAETHLLRAAWATRLMGLSLPEMQAMANQDPTIDAHLESMRELHQVWDAQGVLAMLRQTLHRFELPAKWLAAPEGERRLTNYLHLSELLAHASVTLEGEQALIRWLAQQLQGQGSRSEEQVLRLESDADLVKVITIHKSKGLEFPVVCLPFACSYRKQERKSTAFVKAAWGDEQHTASKPILLDYTEEDLARADEDRLREDIRLLYVAMTRPRYLLWMGFAMLTYGNAKTCKTHESAAGYLVGGPEALSPQDYVHALHALTQACPAVALSHADQVASLSVWRARTAAIALAAPAMYTARFDKRWSIGSFSGLVKAMSGHSSPPGLDLVRTLGSADDETLLEGDSGPSPVPALELETRDKRPAWHRLNRGSLMGNFLHDQLEWLAGEGFELPNPAEISPTHQATSNSMVFNRLLRRCERAGHGAIGEDVAHWLAQVVNVPLPVLGLALRQLETFLPEMEFWLPVAHLKAQALDDLCKTHIWPDGTRPALPDSRLRGFLMGFADLVFEHGGRYWVLDYKSNSLGDGPAAYTSLALRDAVLRHRYDVQAVLYLYALHRLLKGRMGTAYVPEQHLGGVLVYFIRGIDGPECGLVHIATSLPVLRGMDDLLYQEEVLP